MRFFGEAPFITYDSLGLNFCYIFVVVGENTSWVSPRRSAGEETLSRPSPAIAPIFDTVIAAFHDECRYRGELSWRDGGIDTPGRQTWAVHAAQSRQPDTSPMMLI